MGVIIKKGTTEEARRELWAYTNAYTAMACGTDESGNALYFVFDPTDAPMYQDMESNKYIGTFDPLTM